MPMPSGDREYDSAGFRSRLQLAMDERAVTNKQLADAVPLKSPAAVHYWLHTIKKIPKMENLTPAAAFLGVTKEWLAYGLPHPKYPVAGLGPKAATQAKVRELMSELRALLLELLKDVEARHTGDATRAGEASAHVRRQKSRAKRTPGRHSPPHKKRDA